MDTFLEALKNFSMKDMNFEAMAKLNDQPFIELVSFLNEEKVDIVFNALHGGNGENGVISAILDMAGIVYTGSGFEASAVAMNKLKTKILARSVGVRCAEEEVHKEPVHKPQKVTFPLVIKPNDAGSSVGLSILQTEEDIYEATAEALKYSDEVIIESYIPGEEYNVPVIMGEAYPIIEVNPHGVNDYKAKYMGDKTEYKVPADISFNETLRMKENAVTVYNILGLKNYARVDFRMTPEGEVFLLEANTLPGMTASSLVPKSAKALGIDFPSLLTMIIEDALNSKKS